MSLILHLLLFVLLSVTPNIVMFSLYPSGESPRYFLFSILSPLLFLFAVMKVKGEKVKFLAYPSAFIVSFFLWALFQFLFAQNKWYFLTGNPERPTDSLIFFVSIFLVTLSISVFGKEIRRMLLVYITLGIPVALYQLSKLQGISDIFKVRSSGDQGHPINFGIYLMILFFSLLFLFSDIRNKILKFLIFPTTLFFMFLIVRNATRMVVIATVTGLLVITFLLSGVYRKIFLIFLAVFISFSFFSDDFRGRIISLITNPNDNSYVARFYEFSDSIKIIKEHPFTGVGLSNLAYVYPRYRSPELNNIPNEWQFETSLIRNVFLHLAVALGIPGALFFILLLYSIRKYFIHAPYAPSEVILYGGWISLLVIFLFTNFSTTSAIMFFLFSGLLLNTSKIKDLDLVFLPKRVVVVTIMIYLFVLYPIISREALANYYYARSLKLASFEDRVILLSKAIQFSPYSSIYNKRLADLYFDTYEESGSLKLLTYAESEYLNALEKNNLDSHSYSQLATINYIRFKTLKDIRFAIEAENLLKRAISLEPVNVVYLDHLGLLYLSQSKLEDALKIFSREKLLKKDWVVTYFHLGETYRQLGKFDEAIKSYEEVLRISPGNKLALNEIEEVENLKETKVKQ